MSDQNAGAFDGASPSPSLAGGFGGFAGREFPDLPVGAQLLVKVFDPDTGHFKVTTVEVREPHPGEDAVDWSDVQTWVLLPI